MNFLKAIFSLRVRKKQRNVRIKNVIFNITEDRQALPKDSREKTDVSLDFFRDI